MLKILEAAPEGNGPSTLDEFAREGARRMLMEALEADVADYVDRLRALRDADGRALVVRNGRARSRQVTTGTGTMEEQAPRVHDRRSGHRFTSSILPPYMRRSPKVQEVCRCCTCGACPRATSWRPSALCWVRRPRACRHPESLG